MSIPSLAVFAENMHWIDWCIVLGLLVGITVAGVATRKCIQSVADFLAANRCAGRYLLCISQGTAGLGSISIIAFFEMYYKAGFTADWWMLMMTPLALIIALSGWVIYRYRETRVMTMAQFFEVRYSKGVRVYAGILGWLAGIINFGIFPAVGARFMIYFCGFPHYPVHILGRDIDLVYAGVMVVMLSIALFFVFIGGQIAIMVTDFIQGVFTNIVFIIILGAIFWMFDWSTIIDTLRQAPADASLIQPYHTSKVEGFNIFYFLIGAFTYVYGWKAWQGSQGYNASARTAHEAKMAGILGEWRGLVFSVVAMFLPIGAYVIMHQGGYEQVVAEAMGVLDGIPNPQIREQMTVPVVLSKALPVGMIGLLCATMLAANTATHDTYLHSWGSIFVQDVILPFRKRPFTPKQHMRLLKFSIFFVAVFIFFFSLLYEQNDLIFMFFAITGAIYIGGAGSLIIGGLYWKHGSTGGAWAALTIGWVIAVGGMIMRLIWKDTFYPWMVSDAPWLLDMLKMVLEGISTHVWSINWKVGPDEFPLDGQWVNFFAMSLSIVGYITCSLVSWLFSKRPAFNMERMLHRGKYAIKSDHDREDVKPVSGLRAVLPTGEFSLGDKCIYYGKLAWTFAWFILFIIGTVQFIGARNGLWGHLSEDHWVMYWEWRLCLMLLLGVGTIIWFLIGGIIDTSRLFKTLGSLKRDLGDVGIVARQAVEDDMPAPSPGHGTGRATGSPKPPAGT
jgi:SSS family solute:Na+ symporter